MSRILVVGGGISGLTLAHSLKRELAHAGKGAAKITLVESTNRPGGWIRSERMEGFVAERGPRSISIRGTPEGPSASTLSLISELGLDSKIIPADEAAKKRYIYRKGPRPLPFSFGTFFKNPLTKGLIAGGLKELVTPKRAAASTNVQGAEQDDESVHDWFTRRFNVHIAKNFADPMVAGIYAGDPSKLSMKACFPTLYNLERNSSSGSIIRAMLSGTSAKPSSTALAAAAAGAPPGFNPSLPTSSPLPSSLQERFKELKKSALFTVQGGLETIVQSLVASLSSSFTSSSASAAPVDIMYNTSVTRLNPSAAGPVTAHFKTSSGDVTSAEFDYVFSTANAPALASIIRQSVGEGAPLTAPSSSSSSSSSGDAVPALVPGRLASDLEGIKAASVYVVNLLYKRTAEDRVDVYKMGAAGKVQLKYHDAPRERGFGLLVPSSVVKENEIITFTTRAASFVEMAEKHRAKSRFLVDRHALHGLLGVVYDSDVFPDVYGREEFEKDPENGVEYTMLTVMMGGDRFADVMKLSREEAEVLAQDLLKPALGITVKPAAVYATMARECLPQYYLGHTARVARIRRALAATYGVTESQDKDATTTSTAWPRVTAIGASMDSPAITDCVHNAKLCAEQFVKALK